MRRNLGKKVWLVAAMTAALVVVFVATALAAPVLQPGVTSYPGMSGTCTNCHTYATPPAPAPAPTPVATPPAPTTPTVGTSGGGDDGDRPVIKKAKHKKHHRRHHARARRERD